MPVLKEWTVAVWFKAPLSEKNKILVQGKSGTGAIIGANKEFIYIIDKKTGVEVSIWNGLEKLKRGWHHLAVTMNSEGEI